MLGFFNAVFHMVFESFHDFTLNVKKNNLLQFCGT